ncbi:hypothetical protein EYF80_066879 [Liparis tanakae]|uniref:Uncharacterized protein n=1 Tax=Liparis tanakae TaxID=230148 RepID=A0A4Z2E283_9TELE|nr:hypothetical protein EYF80_066879 [Liparis tanakae]
MTVQRENECFSVFLRTCSHVAAVLKAEVQLVGELFDHRLQAHLEERGLEEEEQEEQQEVRSAPGVLSPPPRPATAPRRCGAREDPGSSGRFR